MNLYSSYYVELTTSDGKVLETCPYIYTAHENTGIKIYPNPVISGNILTIEITASSTSKMREAL